MPVTTCEPVKISHDSRDYPALVGLIKPWLNTACVFRHPATAESILGEDEYGDSVTLVFMPGDAIELLDCQRRSPATEYTTHFGWRPDPKKPAQKFGLPFSEFVRAVRPACLKEDQTDRGERPSLEACLRDAFETKHERLYGVSAPKDETKPRVRKSITDRIAVRPPPIFEPKNDDLAPDDKMLAEFENLDPEEEGVF